MKFAVLFFVSLLFGVLFPAFAQADVNNFTITNFEATYVLDPEAVGGSLESTEVISVDFTAQNHGIFRYIPTEYKGYSTKPKVLSVVRDDRPEPFTTYREGDNMVIKIGDANQTITGQHTYQIQYMQERVVNFESEVPEFYWDITGTGWGQPINQVRATVSLKNSTLESQSARCYTGYQGSLDQDCVIQNNGEKVLFSSRNVLNPGQGMTLAVSLPQGVFVEPTWKDTLKDNILNIVGVVLGVAGFGYMFISWMKYGRDYKGSGVIVPQYEPPEKLSPAEVGMLADFRVDNRDLSATLIDMAVRGYIRIHEAEKKYLFVKSKSYALELLHADTSRLKNHEKDMISGIFGDSLTVGQKVELSDLGRTRMTASVQKSRKNILDNLIDTYGLIESKRPKSLIISIIVVAVFGFTAFFTGNAGFWVGFAIFGAGVLFAGIFMQRRSHTGVEMLEQIMGLKLYMNVAEKDRMKMMQGADRPYAEPSKTVELFEKLLPFAVALGVEKSWAKQFDGVLTERPQWIASNSAMAFSGAHLASSITSVTGNFSSNFTTSSGASGGGSSGGGGGGGGGGGW